MRFFCNNGFSDSWYLFSLAKHATAQLYPHAKLCFQQSLYFQIFAGGHSRPTVFKFEAFHWRIITATAHVWNSRSCDTVASIVLKERGEAHNICRVAQSFIIFCSRTEMIQSNETVCNFESMESPSRRTE